MESNLQGLKIAVLVDEGVEQFEMTGPIYVLKAEGANVTLIARKKKIHTNDQGDRSVEIEIDSELSKVNPHDFDALLIPGGPEGIDNLRLNNSAVDFVKHFITENKPIAALSYGQLLLMEADGVKDRKITSEPVIQSDFACAGGIWIDEEVVVDRNIVTSQGMNYLDTFNRKMIDVFEKKMKRKRRAES